MSEFNHEWLGLCEKVVIGKNKTIVINGQGNPEEIKDKAEEIKQGIAEAVSDLEREYLRSRADRSPQKSNKQNFYGGAGWILFPKRNDASLFYNKPG